MTQPPFYDHEHDEAHSSSEEIQQILELSTTSFSLVKDVHGENGKAALHSLKLGNQHYHHYLLRSNMRELDNAIGFYRHAIELKPDLCEGYVRLAAALWDKGAISAERALVLCDAALSVNSKSSEAALYAGIFHLHQEDFPKAIQFLKRAISHAPWKSGRARVILGTYTLKQAYSQKNSPSGAVQHALRLFLQGILQVSFGIMLSLTDFRSYHYIRSLFYHDWTIYTTLWFGKALHTIGLTKSALCLYQHAGENTPNEPIFFEKSGDLAARTSNFDSAIYFYIRALELVPNSLPVRKKLAACYLECADLENAVLQLECVASESPADFDTLYQLAQTYTDLQLFIKALYYFKEAHILQPKNPYVFSNMAFVLFRMEDYDGAIVEYRRAIEFGKDPVWRSTIAQTLATLYQQVKKNYNQAIHLFHTAYELDPTNIEALTMEAELYFEQGRLQNALDLYREIVRLEPDNPGCWNYLGYLLWQLDCNEEAIDAYETAIRLEPNNPIAYNNLGVIYLDEQHNYRQAHVMFEKALNLKLDYTLACFNLGRAEEAMGNLSAAAPYYSRSLTLNSQNPELSDEEIVTHLHRLFDA